MICLSAQLNDARNEMVIWMGGGGDLSGWCFCVPQFQFVWPLEALLFPHPNPTENQRNPSPFAFSPSVFHFWGRRLAICRATCASILLYWMDADHLSGSLRASQSPQRLWTLDFLTPPPTPSFLSDFPPFALTACTWTKMPQTRCCRFFFHIFFFVLTTHKWKVQIETEHRASCFSIYFFFFTLLTDFCLLGCISVA